MITETTYKEYEELRKVSGARYRYFVQWMTTVDSIRNDAKLKVVGWCVRDKADRQWPVVFKHESEVVCRKLAKILNEGVRNE